TGEDVGFEELGGARTHSSRSGVAHYMAPDEADAIEYVKDMLSYLPANTLSPAPSFPVRFEEGLTPSDTALDTLVPHSPTQPDRRGRRLRGARRSAHPLLPLRRGPLHGPRRARRDRVRQGHAQLPAGHHAEPGAVVPRPLRGGPHPLGHRAGHAGPRFAEPA